MIKRIFPLLALVLMFASCGDRRDSIVIEGNISDRQNEYVKLWITEVNRPMLVDSAQISRKGGFKFRTANPTPEPNFYQLGFSQSQFITLLAEGGDNIKVSFNGSRIRDGYTVTGSEESEKVRILDERLHKSIRTIDSLRPFYVEELENPAFAEQPGPIEKQIEAIIDQQRSANISFIISNLTSMASVKALYQRFHEEAYVLGEQRDLQFLKLLTDSLSAKYPGSGRVKAMADDLQRGLNQMRLDQMIRTAQEQDPVTIDPALPTPDGKIVQLSSLKGKYVLVTFWSALSEECRNENNLLKSLYQRYRGLGFEIYQINLDENEEFWRRTVAFEEFPWISVRDSDAQNSKLVTLYNLQRLPAGYLYNRDGEILSAHLSGRQLSIRLDQIFGQ